MARTPAVRKVQLVTCGATSSRETFAADGRWAAVSSTRASTLALPALSRPRSVSATLGCASSHSSVLSASSAAADACAAWKRCAEDDASVPDAGIRIGLGAMMTARRTAVVAMSTLGSSLSSAVAVEVACMGSVPNAHACVASSASSVPEIVAIAVVVFLLLVQSAPGAGAQYDVLPVARGARARAGCLAPAPGGDVARPCTYTYTYH